MDKERIQQQLGELQRQLSSLVPTLHSLDEQRITLMERFLINDSSILDSTEESRFIDLTQASLNQLEQFETFFLQILAYVLLLERHSHYSREFKALHASYNLIEKRLKKITHLRKREIKAALYLQKQKLVTPPFRTLRKIAPIKFIFKRTIRSEILSLLMIVTLSLRSGGELRRLQDAMKTEDKKETVKLAVLGVIFLAPGAGIILCLLTNALLEWLNTFTPNFKRLMKIIKKEV